MINACRNCARDRFAEVLDLGEQRLSDFADDPTYRPPAYPLRLVRCLGCGLAQLDTTVPRDLLYHDRYGFYSGINETIRDDLADVARTARRYVPNPKAWLDIASNDGTLLSFVDPGCYRVGVDPVVKFRDLAQRHADTILPTYFHPDLFGLTRFDVVTSVSVFYDLNDPGAFVDGVREVLDPSGVWIIQQNYLLAMLERTSFDTISHEHLTCWALRPLSELLNRYGLEVLDVATSPVNGGSIRTVVGHTGVRVPAPSVDRQLETERRAELDDDGPYVAFAGRVSRRVAAVRGFATQAQRDGRTVYLYAASTRGAVIWQAADLGPDLVRYAVERNPAKVGRYFSAVGVPIISEDQARIMRPDYLLAGPWWLADQISRRERRYLEDGGRLVFPLPELKVVGA